MADEIDDIEWICKCSSPVKNDLKGREIRNTYIVSFSFLFVFTAYMAIQNLQSSLNQDAGLGVTSLSCLYGSIILSSIMAPTVMKLIGSKLAIVFPWILHVVYTLTNFYPRFWTLIPSSILLGSMSGPLWTSQCTYITKHAYSLVENSGKNQHALLSYLNGIFFTVYELTQILGNMVSSLVFYRDVDGKTTSTSPHLSCGVCDCPFENGNSTTVLHQPSQEVVYTLLGIFLVFDVLGLMLTSTFLPPLPKSTWSESSSIRTSAISCFATFGDHRMFLQVPLLMLMAMEQAVLWTDFTKVCVSSLNDLNLR